MAGYFGSYGDRLRIPVNINQFVNGVRPYPTLSATSPISPGAALGNITEVQSAGWSHYKGLWITANRRMSQGLQLSSSYTLSKSTDTNSYDGTGANANGSLQNSYDLADSEGPSDFDVRHRFSLNGTYELPFHGNWLMDGWQVGGVLQLQSGQPGEHDHQHQHLHRRDVAAAGSGRRSVDHRRRRRSGSTAPSAIRASPAPAAGLHRSVFALPVSADGVFHFGNLPRNAIVGPGFSDTDLSLIKNVTLPARRGFSSASRCSTCSTSRTSGSPGGSRRSAAPRSA